MNKHYLAEFDYDACDEGDGDDDSGVKPFKRFMLGLVIAAACFGAFLLMAYASTASAQTTRTATISLERPTKYTDNTDIPASAAISYRVYQGARGQAKTLVGTITSTSTTINSGLQAGQEYCWEVTAVAGGEESARSNEACKSFRVPVTVTITVT